MVGFNTAGQVLWTGANDYPVIATADNGFIGGSGTTYDQNGNATGQSTALLVGWPNWNGQTQSIGSNDSLQLLASSTEFAANFSPTSSANPSGNNTYVASVAPIEGVWVWGLHWPKWGSPSCKLGSTKASLTGAALEQYNSQKQKLINWLQKLTPASTCYKYFNNDPTRAPYFNQLVPGLNAQNAFDGLLTNISQYDAGLWTPRMASLPTFSTVKNSPVCTQLAGLNRDAVDAFAQTAPPHTDIYINPTRYKHITQGTILHELLHNLTDLEDFVSSGSRHDLPPVFSPGIM